VGSGGSDHCPSVLKIGGGGKGFKAPGKRKHRGRKEAAANPEGIEKKGENPTNSIKGSSRGEWERFGSEGKQIKIRGGGWLGE